MSTSGVVRILHVDGEPEFSELAETDLEGWNGRFEVETATRARDGVDSLRESDFDCIVSGYDLPDKNGIEFLERVREEYPDLPFILFTGAGSEKIASEAISAGVSDYVQKGSGTDRFSLLVNRIETLAEGYRSRRALAERTRRLDTLISNLRGVVYRCQNDPEWSMEYVKGDCEHLTGYRASTVETGDVVWGEDIVHPDEQEELWDVVQDSLDRKEVFEVTYRIITRGGTTKWVSERGRSVYTDDGELEALEGFITNITERKEREQEYERVLELLNHSQEIADVGGWEIDPETQDVFWSDHLFDMQGWDHDEEPPLEEALDIYVEEDRPRIESAVEDALETGEPFAVEARIQRPDGEIRWFDIRGEPTIENGEVVTLRGAVHDITDRRRRERVLREMHDIISNRNHSFDEQVQALLELGRRELDTEYGSLSEIRGEEYVFEYVDADDDSIQPGQVVPVSATNCEIVASTEQTLVLGNIERAEETGRAGFAEWGVSCYIGAPVFVENDVYGTFCFYDTEPRADQFSEWERTLVDLMSSWVSHELQGQQANERLQAQNEQLDQFASIVSHDLRNPLNVADLRLGMAREECNSEHLDHVASAHDRMTALIEDLLTLAHEGDQVGELKPVDLVSLTEDCWRNVATTGTTLSTDIDRQIQADRSRLQQLLENLMRNAVEHGSTSPASKAQQDAVEHGCEDVTVTIGELDGGFYVEDDGSGIPEDERDEVFEAGYSTTGDGTGFGLSIVKRVANAHGWEVRVTDGSEGGARFEITGVEFATV